MQFDTYFVKNAQTLKFLCKHNCARELSTVAMFWSGCWQMLSTVDIIWLKILIVTKRLCSCILQPEYPKCRQNHYTITKSSAVEGELPRGVLQGASICLSLNICWWRWLSNFKLEFPILTTYFSFILILYELNCLCCTHNITHNSGYQAKLSQLIINPKHEKNQPGNSILVHMRMHW